MPNLIRDGKNHWVISKVSFNKFKQAYLKAIKENKDIFMYDNQEVFTQYAKYFLEYWENNADKDSRGNLKTKKHIV